MSVARAGDRGLLIDLDRGVSAEELHAAAAAVRGRPGVLACIAGHSSLYVVFDHEPDLAQWGAGLLTGAARSATPRTHDLTVSFAPRHALDLDAFLQRSGVAREAFFERVHRLQLVARYLGFRAGFAYLDGWPAEWAMPRRATSRPTVPRGSFGIAAAVAGFYPIDSPGGWNILGATDAELWSEERDPPNLIAPGDLIRITPTLRPLTIDATERRGSSPEVPPGVEVLAAPLARMVGAADWSRLEHGVAPEGPFDTAAARAANRAVGQPDDAPLLECAMVGPRVRAACDLVMAWFGAEADVKAGDRPVADPRQFRARGGEVVSIGPLRNGLRGYLAVGDRAGEVQALARAGRNVIRVVAGPHPTRLTSMECEVTSQLDRVGIRLKPLQQIAVSAAADLPSCGMQFGTLQLHPDGTVVAMGPDHPVTGGYLQPMTVKWEERWKLAQLAPGERVRFVE